MDASMWIKYSGRFPQPICNLEELIRVVVTRDDDVSNTVTVFISPDRVINFAMEDRDASEFAIVLAGYYRLMAGKELPLEQERDTQIEDIAPPYLSQHTVVNNGWSYLPSEKPTHSIAFLMPPPYHSTGFRSATGSISSSSRSDECDRNANSARMSNKNTRPSLQGYDFEPNGKDMRVSKEGSHGGKIGGVPMAVSEARNEEVLRRVAEMQKMVESSERYLNEHGDYGHEFDVKPAGKLNFWRETSVDVDESDCESLNSSKQSSNEDGPGVLKHSDSLTLLTETINQGLDGIAKGLSSIYTAPFSELNGKLETMTTSAQNTPKTQRKLSGLSQILSDLQALGNDLSQSESDSESLYTPNSSPIHKTTQSASPLQQPNPQQQMLQLAQHSTANSSTNLRNKSIRTSFGLHSPDSGNEGRDMSLKDYLRQLKEASTASELGTEGTDLAAKKLADLYGYELLGDDSIIETDPDIIDLRSIPPPQTPDELDNLNVLSVPPTGFDDGTGANKVTGTNASSAIASGGTGAGNAANPSNLQGAGDLEEFLKQVTIEPPTQKITPAVELTPEEILSYIIPPPPGLNDRNETTGPDSQKSLFTRHPVQNHTTTPKPSAVVSTNNNINTLKNLNYDTDGPVPRPRAASTNGTSTPSTVANGAIASALLAKYAYDPTRFEVYYPPKENSTTGTTTEYDLYSNSAAAAVAVSGSSCEKKPNGTHDSKGMMNGVATSGASNGHVIEYPTVDRKGPFSCCAKSKSKDKQNGDTEHEQHQSRGTSDTPLALPPKPCSHTATVNQPAPPQRPPKSAELQLRLGSPIRSPPSSTGMGQNGPRANGNYYELGPSDPPSLPPRFEQSPPPVPMLATLPPKKPPLPPVPIKPCILRSPVPILKNTHAAATFNHLHQFHHHHQTPPVPPLPHHLQQHHHPPGGIGVSLSANSSP
uniref:FERM domain-containing protein n=1 Tax=Anopheles maculatus TaxID=74869 RepID=A0A182SDQ4_9DIPT